MDEKEIQVILRRLAADDISQEEVPLFQLRLLAIITLRLHQIHSKLCL